MKRRTFVKSAMALAAAGIPVVPTSALAEGEVTNEKTTEKSRVRSFRPLGKSGIQMGDISFGAGRLNSKSLVLRAIDRGMNYFDTAPDYGGSEDFIGEALKQVKGRDKIHIASKYCQPIPFQAGKSHLQVGAKQADYVAAVENSLKRMGTDYLDVVFVHAIGEKTDLAEEKARLLDPEMLAATESLKKAGKVRFLAVSSHGPNNMEPLMLEAVRSGHFDILMMAFNFMKFPKIPDVFKEAKARDIGVIAMKVLAGAKEQGIKFDPGQFEQAAFKWALQHAQVSGLVTTIQSAQDLDLFLPASGQAFNSTDQRVLDHYAVLHGRNYCRTGCGDCLEACPDGVDVATILRYQMYFENYGDEKQAMRAYSALEKSAASCGSCVDEACNQACPYGLAVGQKLQAAHRMLS
ncbi:MAG: aldo/keto reductase, partial [Magnetococcales bacterium]|nr:aldo/keto reductase [Magnetococcales bacterium]